MLRGGAKLGTLLECFCFCKVWRRWSDVEPGGVTISCRIRCRQDAHVERRQEEALETLGE